MVDGSEHSKLLFGILCVSRLPSLPSRTNINYDFSGSGEYVAACGIPGDGALETDMLVDACNPERAYDGDTLAIHYRFAPQKERG